MMECHQALNEIGPLIDGELRAAERAAIEAHLAACADCRAAFDGLRIEDAELLRAFMPRRQAAAALADRVIRRMRGERQTRLRLRTWAVPLAAAAAGFLLAMVVLRPSADLQSKPTIALPVARLAVATGPTEVRAPDDSLWSVCAPSGDIAAGASVRTVAGARCELETSDGTQIRLDAGTQIELPKPRCVKITQGELYSCVTGGEPFEIQMPDAKVEATRGIFDFTCPPGETSMTVIEGSAKVECKSGTRRVEQGESVRLIDGRIEAASAVSDPLQATAWVNELLILKGAENPELAERLNDILAQIGQTKVSYLYEDEIRRLGSRAALPLLRYVESPRSIGSDQAREAATRLAADLADSTVIGDLIRLLADDNPRVRFHVAQALERLTGQNQGRPAEAWQEDSVTYQPTLEAWTTWWQERGGTTSSDAQKTSTPPSQLKARQKARGAAPQQKAKT